MHIRSLKVGITRQFAAVATAGLKADGTRLPAANDLTCAHLGPARNLGCIQKGRRSHMIKPRGGRRCTIWSRWTHRSRRCTIWSRRIHGIRCSRCRGGSSRWMRWIRGRAFADNIRQPEEMKNALVWLFDTDASQLTGFLRSGPAAGRAKLLLACSKAVCEPPNPAPASSDSPPVAPTSGAPAASADAAASSGDTKEVKEPPSDAPATSVAKGASAGFRFLRRRRHGKQGQCLSS